MTFESTWNPHSPVAQQRREAALTRLTQWHALQDRAALASAQSKPVFDKRGQLLPRERVALLLDPGAPFLPLCALAGFMQDTPDPAKSVPGGGMIAGIGFISGVRCMVVASDSGIEAGAIQARGLEKILRVQELALENKLPFVHLVESAGANLMQYKVEGFVLGGSLFRNLARLSAAGLPVLTVQHGSGTAGGAYMPGLSDTVIMVRGRSRAFLAGPPLLKAATGEVATEEELGGAEMHTSVSGLGEYLCEDDRHALGTARDVVARWDWAAHSTQRQAKPPRWDAEELLGLMPAHHRHIDPAGIADAAFGQRQRIQVGRGDGLDQGGPQPRRQQDAAGGIHLQQVGVAEHQALVALQGRIGGRQLQQALFHRFPVGFGVQQQVLGGFQRNHQAMAERGQQCLPVLGRYGQTPLAVERDNAYAADHFVVTSPEINALTLHNYPQCPTFRHYRETTSAGQY